MSGPEYFMCLQRLCVSVRPPAITCTMLPGMYNVLKIQRLTRELAAALVAEFGPVEAARRLEHAAGEIMATARMSNVARPLALVSSL